MKTIIAALFLATAASASQAQIIRDDWTEADTVRQVAFTAVLVADYGQTMGIKNHKGFTESNPLLGKHPGDARIRNYFLGAAVLHYGVSRALPAGWPRQTFQYAWIAIEVAQVIRNKRIGATMDF